MMNQVIIVGRIGEIGEYNKESLNMTIIVPNQFKDENGEYKKDIIPVVVYGAIAERTSAYCNKGDVIGVKGRIVIRGEKLTIDVDRVTFLSTKKKEEK